MEICSIAVAWKNFHPIFMITLALIKRFNPVCGIVVLSAGCSGLSQTGGTADRNGPTMIRLRPPKDLETESKFN